MPTARAARRAPYQRARAPAHKAERLEAILDAAEARVRREPFADIQMSDLARRVGLVKGTLYLYFPTKEALFVAVVRRVFARFFAAAAAGVAAAPATRAGVCGALAGAIGAEPALRPLVAVLHTALEHNLSDRGVADFKRFLLGEVTALGARIDARLRWPAGSGARLVLRLHVLVIGLHHVATPSPAVRRALADPALALFRSDFAAQLAELLPLVAHPLPEGETP
ncbi:MAG TPA: TetR family transcriptional regulator [Myxococcota bacterium]|nr:TetR family transcriptional regulator [Myxococcota bacterium]